VARRFEDDELSSTRGRRSGQVASKTASNTRKMVAGYQIHELKEYSLRVKLRVLLATPVAGAGPMDALPRTSHMTARVRKGVVYIVHIYHCINTSAVAVGGLADLERTRG